MSNMFQFSEQKINNSLSINEIQPCNPQKNKSESIVLSCFDSSVDLEAGIESCASFKLGKKITCRFNGFIIATILNCLKIPRDSYDETVTNFANGGAADARHNQR